MANKQESDTGWTLVPSKPKGRHHNPPPVVATLPALAALPPVPVPQTPPSALASFEQLPVEIRNQIYHQLLRFRRTLRHRHGLLPFLLSNKGDEKRASLAKDVLDLLPNTETPADGISIWDVKAKGVGLLGVNKKILEEALKELYNLNSFYIPAALLCIKRLSALLPETSDLALIRDVRIAADPLCWISEETAVATTVRGLDRHFKGLRTVTIEIDALNDVLFIDIYLAFKNMPGMKDVKLDDLACFSAVSEHAVKFIVQHGTVVRVVKWLSSVSPKNRAIKPMPVSVCAQPYGRYAQHYRKMFRIMKLLEGKDRCVDAPYASWEGHKTVLELVLGGFNKYYVPKGLVVCTLQSLEFWTYAFAHADISL